MLKYNEDKKYFGLKLRTRVRRNDEKIINECLGNDFYCIPENLYTVIDIGSNIGCVALNCAKRGARRVIAFEPCIDNYGTLKHNVEINGFQSKVQCINKGVGIKNKETKLFLHNKNSGAISSKLNYNRGLNEDNYEVVEFISIHDVFKDYNIKYCDLIKLDCEGSEEDIIRELDEDLISRINQISVEFHNQKLIPELVYKLSRYYEAEHIKRTTWVFRKKEKEKTIEEVFLEMDIALDNILKNEISYA
jgi:FkbM family methyltransferase